MRAGAKIVAGTDTPNAFNLHGELATYVMAGMTPFEALGLDAGSIEAGKLADIVLVEGNPLEDIANGRVYSVEDLLKGPEGLR